MRRFRWMMALLSLSLPVPAAESRYGAPELLCRFQDPRVSESSGLSASRSDGYFFTHNDSGDGPHVYAVDRKGQTLARFKVKGVMAFDWEDMARGPDEAGRLSLFLADIGDNFRFRTHLTVYRIPEPEVDTGRTGAAAEMPSAVSFDLKYPDGAHDAEGLMVHPKTGQLFVVTKSPQGTSVFSAPVPLKPSGINALTKIATIRFDALPATEGTRRDAAGSRLATGADFSPDGTRLVIRTYTDAWEWTVEGNDVAAAFRRAPAHVKLPNIPGGEAITYSRDGRALIVSTEGVRGAVHELRAR